MGCVMLEEVLMSITSLAPNMPAIDALPAGALPIPYLCSILGALILSKFTGRLGNLTVPLNCAALFIGAMLSTSLLSGIDLPVEHGLLQPLFVSLVGMLGGAFLMMFWLHPDNAHS